MSRRWTPDQLQSLQRRTQPAVPGINPLADALASLPKKTKAPKYKNIKTVFDGITFDSKAEAERYAVLKRLLKFGLIADLERQVVYELAPSVVLDGRKRPPLRYVADFRYTEDGKRVVEDVKGSDDTTAGYRLKRHLMMAVHGIEVKEYRKGKR